MSRIRIIMGALALTASLALSACATHETRPTPTPQPTVVVKVDTKADAIALPVTPVAVSNASIDACADAIVAKRTPHLTERDTRRMQSETFTYDGMSVTVNAQGIWGGCKAALVAKAAEPTRVSISTADYGKLRHLAYVNSSARYSQTYQGLAENLQATNDTLTATNARQSARLHLGEQWDVFSWLLAFLLLVALLLGTLAAVNGRSLAAKNKKLRGEIAALEQRQTPGGAAAG